MGRLFGIPVLVMPAVLALTLLLLVVAAQRGGASGFGAMLGLLGLLAVALLAHELGHALVARRLGVHVVDITIWPLGGMANIQDMTSRPAVEAPVALAGPAVNLALAAACALLPGHWAAQATWLNLVLGAGNLLPAFPLDGGRVLRAWFARAVSLSDATRAAVTVSTFLTVGLIVAAFFLQAAFLGLLLGTYILWTANQELLQIVLRTGLPPTRTLGEVIRASFRGRRPHPDGTAGADPDPAEHEELEEFRGSLKEYFQHRNRT